ncbi:transcription factor bHLH115 [Coffea arabica]|uniref:Transcription factor bHLH115 n=1 Tax=Coffea arabica TaxID=13443 RepID=A0A6P6VPU3_COFAR|nr:transcription factor bHLH115-like [Coffea arabica]
MASPEEDSNWVFDFGLIEDIPVPGGDLPPLDPGFQNWSNNSFYNPNSVELDGAFQSSRSRKEASSRKRARSGPCSATDSKAYREKMRRDKLNDRFQELSFLLDPERPPKVDKSAILGDATRMLIQLRDEAEKLKESYERLQEKVNELKAEKNELRDEKQKQKAEKDKLEHQLKALSSQTGFLSNPSAILAPFVAPHQVFSSKMTPFVGYPGTSMWHFMPPAAVDTSEDHVLRPPVA